jgi:hypothetical protein
MFLFCIYNLYYTRMYIYVHCSEVSFHFCGVGKSLFNLLFSYLLYIP